MPGVVISSGDEHIWTFVNGVQPPDTFATDPIDTRHCPCLIDEHAAAGADLPDFVGSDYFCESLPTSLVRQLVQASSYSGMDCTAILEANAATMGLHPFSIKSFPLPPPISTSVGGFFVDIYIICSLIQKSWFRYNILV